MADDLCPHRVPRASFCKRCDQEKAARAAAKQSKPKPSARLEATERARLASLEATVERGLGSFVEVGVALMEIREARLYRDSHGTFEAYCRDRWRFTPQHGGRLIAAAEVARELEPVGSIPANEAQARELVPLLDRPDEMRTVAAEVAADGKPTAAKVRAAVNERLGRDDVRPAPAELVCVPRDLLVRAADGLRIVGSAEVDQDALAALADELAEATA